MLQLLSRATTFVAAVIASALTVHAAATPAPPTAEAEPASTQTPSSIATTPAPNEVDIITAAGKAERPPPRKPSIGTQGPALRWDPAWRPFGVGNFVGTGLMIGLAVGSLAIPPDEDRWSTANAFDNSVRNVLRLDGSRARFAARDTSDITLMLSINQLLVDSLVVTWWGYDAGQVALQMTLMNIEAIAFNSGLNGVVTGISSRERPYRKTCVGDAATELRDCRSNKRYRSFYSGHTSTAFTAAGLTCMHHSHLPLYGGGVADALICVGSFGIAAATGTLRVVSDQHWASDVLVGAAMGTFSGVAIPWLFHYRTGDLPEPSPDEISVSVVPTPTGAILTGVF